MRKLDRLRINQVPELAYHLGTSEGELNRVFSDLDSYYYTKTRVKPNGKERITHTPTGRLKHITKKLNGLLQRLDFPEYVHCAVKGRSNITNARVHTRQDILIKFDLKDFFPNISHKQVYRTFQGQQGCGPEAARALTLLTTYKGQVPQGSPSSTIVATLVLLPVLRRLNSLAEKHGAKFTQYVDDLTFSGPRHLISLKPLIYKIIRSGGFIVNEKKTEVTNRAHPQLVTGVRVNDGVDVPPEKAAEVRRLLKRVSCGDLPLDDSLQSKLRGMISYIGQLNPGRGKIYQKKLNALINKAKDQ